MNARRCPCRILCLHATDQLTDLAADLRTSGPKLPGPPPPKQTKACPMPGNHGFRLHDDQGFSPARIHPAQRGPEEAIEAMQSEVGLAVLNDLHQRMLQVIEERALSPDLASVPGGKTGLVTKTLKGIGKGDDFQVVEVYEVDTGTIAKIGDVQKQVAEELGQWVRRSEVTDMHRLFERMSREELHAYAREGILPDWFPAKPQQEVMRNAP